MSQDRRPRAPTTMAEEEDGVPVAFPLRDRSATPLVHTRRDVVGRPR
jgi:hypothetical protein